MKAWLKGGIIGFLIAFIIVMVMFVSYGSCNRGPDSTHCGSFNALIHSSNIIIAFIFGIIVFIPGAIIGFIVGKIKNK